MKLLFLDCETTGLKPTEWFKKNGNPYFYGYVNYHLLDVIQATALFTVAGKMKLQNMKLGTVCEHFGISLKAHDALEDIRATRQVFYRYADVLTKEEYQQNSLAWVDVCDEIWILKGWETSGGTIREIARAEELGIPVKYL